MRQRNCRLTGHSRKQPAPIQARCRIPAPRRRVNVLVILYTMSSASPSLQPAHRKLLQLVYDRFHATGAWPSARSVRVAIRQEGELTDLCRELGSRLIVCGPGDSPAGKCELRVHALLHVQGADRDTAHIVVAIQYLV